MWSQKFLWRPRYVRIYNPEELTMRKYKFHGEKLVFREGLAAFRGGYENRIGFVEGLALVSYNGQRRFIAIQEDLL